MIIAPMVFGQAAKDIDTLQERLEKDKQKALEDMEKKKADEGLYKERPL